MLPLRVLMLSRDAGNPRLKEYSALVKELRVIDAHKPWPASWRRGRWNLITAQDPFENGFIAWMIARICGARLELQVHTDFLSPHYARERFINRIRIAIAKFILPRADCVRVVSERIRKYIPNAVVLPIFVDAEKIADAPVAIDLHKEYPQFKKIIVMISRLTREKNIRLALSAFGDVRAKFPDAGLVVVGDGPERHLLSGHENVISVGWVKDPISYYKTADVFLQTSNYEGYGMSIVTAAIVGCPIVTTDVGCVGEVITDRHALIVPVGDRAALVSALERALCGDIPKPSLSLGTKEEYLTKMKSAWENCCRA